MQRHHETLKGIFSPKTREMPWNDLERLFARCKLIEGPPVPGDGATLWWNGQKFDIPSVQRGDMLGWDVLHDLRTWLESVGVTPGHVGDHLADLDRRRSRPLRYTERQLAW
jgi:hypothetical protein